MTMVSPNQAIVCARFVDFLSDEFIATDWRPEAPVKGDEVTLRIDDHTTRTFVVTSRRWLTSGYDVDVRVSPDRREPR